MLPTYARSESSTLQWITFKIGNHDFQILLGHIYVVLKCYVLIDLKLGAITHQDVGQMDMYVRMYDEQKRTEGNEQLFMLQHENKKDKEG